MLILSAAGPAAGSRPAWGSTSRGKLPRHLRITHHQARGRWPRRGRTRPAAARIRTPLASAQRPDSSAGGTISSMDIPRRGDQKMRKTLTLGIGAGAVAAAVTMVAGVASATSGAPHQATGPAAAVAQVNLHITKAQAIQIAEAKFAHSRAIEFQSYDLND